MNNETNQVIEKFKAIKDILKEFFNKDERVEYLINETKLLRRGMF